MNISSSPWNLGANLSNYYGQSNVITPGSGESIYLPAGLTALSNDHGLPSDFYTTGYYDGTTRKYVSNISPQAGDESTIGNDFLAHNGSYLRPVVGQTTTDSIDTSYRYIYFDGTSYSTQQLILPTFASRQNTTIFNLNTFKNSGTINWDQAASSYTELADVSASGGNYVTRQWGLVINNELVDTQSSAAGLGTKLEDLRAAARLAGSSLNFSYVYIDELSLGGKLFQVLSDAYQWNYRSDRYNPTEIIAKIGANGLLNINFDKPSKYLDTLTNINTSQSAQYEEIDAVKLTGIKGNVFDKTGKKITSENMGNAIAEGTGFDVYGTARIKDLQATGSIAGTFNLPINYVVYNQAVFNKMTSGDFIPNYNYNTAARVQPETKRQTEDLYNEGYGENENIAKKRTAVLEKDSNGVLKSLEEPTAKLKGLYYETPINKWTPFLSAAATYPAGAEVTGGITKATDHSYLGAIANIGVSKGNNEQDKFTNADLKLFGTWRPILTQKWIFSTGYAAEGAYSQNPFGENIYNITHGINFHNRFNVLEDFSFYCDIGSVSATGLNKYSDIKDSVMQTWNGKAGAKYRFNSQWAANVSASYSRLNIYYDKPTLNMFNPGIVADDNYTDKAGAEIAITKYSKDASNATTLKASVSRTIHNAKDNPEKTNAKITLEHVRDNITYQGWISTTQNEGGLSGQKQRENSAGLKATIRFN